MMAGQRTRRVFLHGNHDVVHALLTDDRLRRQSQAQHGAELKLIVQHEPGVRIDLLRQQLSGQDRPVTWQQSGLADAFLSAQFHSPLSEQTYDVVILALEPNLNQTLWQHRETGGRLQPPAEWQTVWSAAQQRWLTEQCHPLPPITPAQFIDDMTAVVQALQHRDIDVLVFGLSSFDPEDEQFVYHDLDQPTPIWRIHQFNHALIQLSADLGLPIIDVDRLVAELGAAENVVALLTYSDSVAASICREVIRILDDMRLISPTPPLTKLVLPRPDRFITEATVTRWYKQEGAAIYDGDDLFEAQVDSVHGLGSNRPVNFRMVVHAVDSGYLRQVLAPVGAAITYQDTLALMSQNPEASDSPAATDSALPRFRTTTTILEPVN